MSAEGDIKTEIARREACIAALAGIADPAKQVERWKALETWLRICEPFLDTTPRYLPPAEIAVLAAKWGPDVMPEPRGLTR